MTRTDGRRTAGAVLLLLLIAAVTVFIISRSTRDAAASSAESREVMDLILSLFPFLRPYESDLFHAIIRKLAHFTEFAVLGGLYAALAALFSRRPLSRFTALGLLLPLATAVTDETVQYFTGGGRSGSPLDVLLDFAGALCGALFLAAILELVKKSTAKKSKKRKNARKVDKRTPM